MRTATPQKGLSISQKNSGQLQLPVKLQFLPINQTTTTTIEVVVIKEINHLSAS